MQAGIQEVVDFEQATTPLLCQVAGSELVTGSAVGVSDHEPREMYELPFAEYAAAGRLGELLQDRGANLGAAERPLHEQALQLGAFVGACLGEQAGLQVRDPQQAVGGRQPRQPLFQIRPAALVASHLATSYVYVGRGYTRGRRTAANG